MIKVLVLSLTISTAYAQDVPTTREPPYSGGGTCLNCGGLFMRNDGGYVLNGPSITSYVITCKAGWTLVAVNNALMCAHTTEFEVPHQ